MSAPESDRQESPGVKNFIRSFFNGKSKERAIQRRRAQQRLTDLTGPKEALKNPEPLDQNIIAEFGNFMHQAILQTSLDEDESEQLKRNAESERFQHLFGPRPNDSK